MSAPDLVALTKAVAHCAAQLAAARESELDAMEVVKEATAARLRYQTDLSNARTALDKALDS